MKPRALVSVTDKTGSAEFAKGLISLGFEIVSTGGTARHLREHGIELVDVSDLTGFQEMLDGRVKTLHPHIHGGILADLNKPEHRAQLVAAGIGEISIVAVNLYAFEATISGPHSLEQAIESIDIGGPTLIRAAAKNSSHVAVVVDPNDYELVLEAIANRSLMELRRGFMAKAFQHTAYYDSMIAHYFSKEFSEEKWPTKIAIGLNRQHQLRYGENPHQDAAIYRDPLSHEGIPNAKIVWGKELSYNNILDADAAWELVCDLPDGSVAIIKHGNPCGVAAGPDSALAYQIARRADPISAFGGIAAVRGKLDKPTAEAMCETGNFLEVILATDLLEEALDVFRNRSGWGQTVRILQVPLSSTNAFRQYRGIRGGFLAQFSDETKLPQWNVVTVKQPTADQMEALKFQNIVAQHVKSNAIVIGLHDRILGIGAGQMNRIQSVKLALEQAGDASVGAVLASDAFFPFPDSIETAGEAGIAAIVQPGGSKKDDLVISKANDLGIAMVFTGVRHFRH